MIMWRCNIVFLILLGGCCHAYAQNVVFTAAAGASKIGVKDRVQIQYTIRDAQDLQTVTSPSGNDFVVVAGPYQQQSSNTTITGNRMVQSQSISLTYVIQPKHEGTINIAPVTAKDAAGHTYQSNAVTIQVVAGSLAQQQQQQRQMHDPFGGDEDDVFAMMQRMQQMQQQQMAALQQRRMAAQGQVPQQQQPQAMQQQKHAEPAINDEEIKKDLFIQVVVDKNKVHVGEQITTSYKLYSRLPMQMNISKLPNLNGFWTEDFELPKQIKPTEETFNGKKYQVFLLKKSALFPQQPGSLELDPAEAKGVARIVQQVKRSAADIFGGTLMMNDPFFNNAMFNTTAYKDVEVHLKSSPIKITVTDLPDKNKPADYTGAVGNFTINNKIDKQEITTDEVANLTLTITGSGNLKLIQPLKLELPNGISTYDPQVVDTITSRSTTISGSKILTYAITPQTPGDYDIPALPFTYYNTQSGNYVTLHTQPFKLHVKPGKNYATKVRTTNNVALKDIHEIATKPLTIALQSRPLLLTAGYWSLYAFPTLAFLGMIVWKKRDEELSKDTALLRRKRANKVAFQRLSTAKKLLTEHKKTPFYEEISKAIWLYLSDKLSIPLSALSRETATEVMTERKVPTELQKRLENVIWECETALYASAGSDKMNTVYEEAIKVISDLEDAFKA